jgi:hypothetical protein
MKRPLADMKRGSATHNARLAEPKVIFEILK